MPRNFYTEIDVSELVSRPHKGEWKGDEKIFRELLYKSISEVGIKAPIHLWYDSPLKRNGFVVRAGKSRVEAAFRLGIKKIKCIITHFSPDNNKFKGRSLKTESEIKELFHVPESVHIMWDEGHGETIKEAGWLVLVNTAGGKSFVNIWSKEPGYFK